MIVLPGDQVPPEKIPASKTKEKPVTLGPGLCHVPPSSIVASVAGELRIDSKKRALWVENIGGRYVPTVGDQVIATVHHTSVDYYHCAITANTSLAILPQLAFEGATRKTRPVLQPGALVYARVAHADKFMDAELDCVHPSSGKADGLGPLKGGMLFDISLTMARRLMSHKAHEQGNLVVLQEIAERLPFEIAVGGNGKLWVQSEKGAATLAIGRAIVQIDQEGIGVEAQKSFARKMLDRL